MGSEKWMNLVYVWMTNKQYPNCNKMKLSRGKKELDNEALSCSRCPGLKISFSRCKETCVFETNQSNFFATVKIGIREGRFFSNSMLNIQGQDGNIIDMTEMVNNRQVWKTINEKKMKILFSFNRLTTTKLNVAHFVANPPGWQRLIKTSIGWRGMEGGINCCLHKAAWNIENHWLNYLSSINMKPHLFCFGFLGFFAFNHFKYNINRLCFKVFSNYQQIN